MKKTKSKSASSSKSKLAIWKEMFDLHSNSWVTGTLMIAIATVVAIVAGKLVRGISEYLAIDFLDADSTWVLENYIGAIVAAVSAGLVVWQLKHSASHEKHLTDVEEAEYIFDFNKSFVDNKQLTEIERFLECRLTDVKYGKIKNIEEYRQDMVNYLVYLEGLAACVLSGILTINKIDDLLAYRFFIAMNHIETQAIDLLPYAPYYRGCFKLYEKWLGHRITCGVYSEDDNWEIPLFETALCNHYGYEKYACPDMTLNVTRKNSKWIFTAQIPKQGKVELSIDENCLVTITENTTKNRTTYLSLLRRILKELVYANEFENTQFKELIKNNSVVYDTDDKYITNAKKHYYTFFGNGILAIDIAEDDKKSVDAVKLFNEIQYTKAIICAREQAKENELQFVQLQNLHELSEKQRIDIAKLIYDTDKYIYPDMFGNKNIAMEVIPEFLSSGSDAMFATKNLFVCFAGERIVGIILWHKGPLNWSNCELKEKINAYFKTHESDDEAECNNVISNMEKVSEKYIHEIDSRISNPSAITVLNFCIDSNVRRMGIASAMLAEFLENHKNETVELRVLSKNVNAINICRSNGFNITTEEQAYPETKKGLKRLVMIRKA